jgi:hypothetical protein
MKPCVALLTVTCLLPCLGCDKKIENVRPPRNVAQVVPPQQIVGFGPDLSFRFFHWENGLNLLLVDDIQQGNREHESSVGPADNPVRRHRGSASTADGRTYAWQLETKDERTGKFTVDRREYDLSKGTLLLVKTQGKTVQVLQLDRPLADVPFDVDGCRDYLQKQKEVLAFLETGGLQIQELESGENLFRVAGQTAFVFKYSGSPVHFWIELDSDGNKQRHEVADLPFLFLEPPAPKQVLEGYFVWVRGEADDAGREMWRLGFQKSLVSEESSIIRDISPVVQAHGTQSKTTRDTSTTSLYPTVQVWKGSLFRRIRG